MVGDGRIIGVFYDVWEGEMQERVARWLAFWQESEADLDWVLGESACRLVSVSEYAGEQLRRYPMWWDFVCAPRDWRNYDFMLHWQEFSAQVGADEEALMRALRLFKHRHQVALIEAVVSRRLAQVDFLYALSALAQCLLQAAYDWHWQALVERYGYPLDGAGEKMGMVILGMGKLGGWELNFSSDVDLMFAFAEEGMTQAGAGQRSLEHSVFFRKLAQKVIYALDALTVEGFVYRVDMRLRPFGQSGALAITFEAMAQYYARHGRDWERYALMKARAVAGDKKGGAVLLGRLQGFMYRRQLDYQALEAITQMKLGINRQIQKEGMARHLKLGVGGIREAEFCVQAMQMIYGGIYPLLQGQNFLQALWNLARLELWSKAQAQALSEAYLLLRTLENALQFDKEKQVHHLPETAADWQRLALASGFLSVEALEQALEAARMCVDGVFQEVFVGDEMGVDEGLSAIDWRAPDLQRLALWLEAQGVCAEEAEQMGRLLVDFARQMRWEELSEQAVARLQKVLAQMLMQSVQRGQAQALQGLLALLLAVSERAQYVELLAEQTNVVGHLCDIAVSSSWLMRFICEHPLVLDEVLGERRAFRQRAQLERDLAARLQGLEDDELWVQALRAFKDAQLFKIAWADVHGTMGLMTVSDCLSEVAELVLECAYQRALLDTQRRYGLPLDGAGNRALFAVVAYGKLGGVELSYASDLDLLFLYDEVGGKGMTDGEKSVDNAVFFAKLVQRLTHYLASSSSGGRLYEVDMRLRPSGRAGMLVSSLAGFAAYQKNNAWTWEHQALSRARFICGDMALGEAFTALRREVLCLPRAQTLASQVKEMREKMWLNFIAHGAGEALEEQWFDLKQSRGGLIDIEFMVQFLLLNHAYEEPVIARMSDNIRQLAALEATGIIGSSMAMTLRDAYRRLREAAHHRYLNGQNNVVAAKDWQGVREQVLRIYDEVFKEKVKEI